MIDDAGPPQALAWLLGFAGRPHPDTEALGFLGFSWGAGGAPQAVAFAFAGEMAGAPQAEKELVSREVAGPPQALAARAGGTPHPEAFLARLGGAPQAVAFAFAGEKAGAPQAEKELVSREVAGPPQALAFSGAAGAPHPEAVLAGLVAVCWAGKECGDSREMGMGNSPLRIGLGPASLTGEAVAVKMRIPLFAAEWARHHASVIRELAERTWCGRCPTSSRRA